VEKTVTRKLPAQDMDFYKRGPERLFLLSDKCLVCGGNYVEKYWSNGAVKCGMLLLQLKVKHQKCVRYKLIL
jgi:hypothetical protein